MKSIVICCDGTWNQPFVDGNYSTNVQIISEILNPNNDHGKANDSTKPIIVYYNAGIGTGGNDLLYGRVAGMEDGYFATTLPEHIKNAYKFLVDNYEPGDKIYLFGFSRGAFTVRSLASFIWYCGLLKKEGYLEANGIRERYTDKHINMVYSLYQQKALAKGPQATDLEISPAQAHKNVDIEFLGVFDTVSALRERDLKLHDAELHTHIKKARHALAHDEHRKGFNCTLWQNSEVDSVQKVFEGDHADIGGGWEFNRLVKLYKGGEPSDNDVHYNELCVFIKLEGKNIIHVFGKYWEDGKVIKYELGNKKIANLFEVTLEEGTELLAEWKNHFNASRDKIVPTPLTDKLFFSYRLSNIALRWMLKESELVYFDSSQLTAPLQPLLGGKYRTHSSLLYDDMKDTCVGIVLWGIYYFMGSIDRVFLADDLENLDGKKEIPTLLFKKAYQDYLETENHTQIEIAKSLEENKDLLEQAVLVDKIDHAISQLLKDLNELDLSNKIKPHRKTVFANNKPSFDEIKAKILSDVTVAVENYELLLNALNKGNFTGTNLAKAEQARLILASLKPLVEQHKKNVILRSIENSHTSNQPSISGANLSRTHAPMPAHQLTLDEKRGSAPSLSKSRAPSTSSS